MATCLQLGLRLWTLVFATLAVFAPLIKSFVDDAGRKFGALREKSAQARSEAAYLESARNDPRVMAELRAAISRHETVQIHTFGQVVEPIEMPEATSKVRPLAWGRLRYM